MIDRYSTPEMSKIWTEHHKFSCWLRIEILVCEAWCELGVIPQKSLKVIQEKASFDLQRIQEIEERTQHDVIAFLTSVSECVGADSRYIHYGMTSSDILDTSLSLCLVESSDLLLNKLHKLRNVFKNKALKYKGLPTMGRSHGIHAEPTTFGLKMLQCYEETSRNIYRLERARECVRVGMISGPVGTYSQVDPFVEKYVCEKLGLQVDSISTQIIQRDRYAEYLLTLSLIASSLDKFALEVRSLQRTEVREVEEFFGRGQKGSSAMPHKKNPIISERLCGLARLLRGNAVASLENVALWHERDISHSSVERVIIPDSNIVLDYMLTKAIDLFDHLVVYPENMDKNISLTRGLCFSQSVLLLLIKKGLLRERAYEIVQKVALDVWRDSETNFQNAILHDSSIKKHLSKEELSDCFDMNNLLACEEKIYERVFS